MPSSTESTGSAGPTGRTAPTDRAVRSERAGRAEHRIADDAPVYVISVAAMLAGMHPQTLRTYDRLGLVCPGRASGRGRRYSARDIAALREVQRLSQEDGVNLAGIKRILHLENDVMTLRRQLVALERELEETRRHAQRREQDLRADSRRELVPVRRYPPVVWRSPIRWTTSQT